MIAKEALYVILLNLVLIFISVLAERRLFSYGSPY